MAHPDPRRPPQSGKRAALTRNLPDFLRHPVPRPVCSQSEGRQHTSVSLSYSQQMRPRVGPNYGKFLRKL